MAYKALIFDLDGTLTDSTRVFVESVSQGLSTFGITLRKDVFDEWHSNHEHWEHLLLKHQADPTHWQALERVVFDKYDELLATDCEWLGDAEEMLKQLRDRKIPMAIVTNSYDPFIETMNKAVPLKTFFPIIITATLMQEKRKPDPYGLLLAAERLGVAHQDCLFIGDQRFDMQAANAAGMDGCLFEGPHTPKDVALIAKHEVASLKEVLALLD